MSYVVLRGATVFDGSDFLPGPSDVVFADERVLEVGPGLAGSDAYVGATVVDCSGNTVLPGLIDLHVHMAFSNPGSLNAFVEPFSLQFYKSVKHLEATLRAGVTTVRDAGGADLGTKMSVEQGMIQGPRMRIAVSIMSQTGGHGDQWMPSGVHSPAFSSHPGRPSGVADGVEEARRVARQILRAGADQIKICSTGGVLSPADDPRHAQFTEEEIRVIVGEAAVQGRYVMAHAQAAAGVKNALRAGVRSIEHGIYLDDEAIELFLERDAYLVPTLAAPLAVIKKAEAGGSGLPAPIIEKARLVVESHRESIAKAVAAGVRIGMGTDSGVGVHGENLEELCLLVDVGMDLTAVLRACTSVAGELIAPENSIGRLAPGFLADAVVLKGNLTTAEQLADLPAMVQQVWKDGQIRVDTRTLRAELAHA
ncbi:metal-dependent hydrolase family protein [Amycolatopsis palatopharyngis]|uniref:metal-dependent hydrolase family protein n=1 Tax=Amycolatopsis palatopharyngis TaxID=187982 RepID=UPI000E21E8FA|nr:amidohydrolase family protein [Amycolatopsis palatopharyngis]